MITQRKPMIMILGLLICFLFCACGSGQYRETAETNGKESSEEAGAAEYNGEGMLPVNETKDGIIVDDILECRHMIGKTAEESGIPESVISEKMHGFLQTYADGNIFGTKDYGIIYFAKADDGNPGIADSVWIHIKNTGYEDCYTELQKLFGDPISEGEEPYVEANGGAVMWAVFRDGEYELKLSSASEREYTEINITKAK